MKFLLLFDLKKGRGGKFFLFELPEEDNDGDEEFDIHAHAYAPPMLSLISNAVVANSLAYDDCFVRLHIVQFASIMAFHSPALQRQFKILNSHSFPLLLTEDEIATPRSPAIAIMFSLANPASLTMCSDTVGHLHSLLLCKS